MTALACAPVAVAADAVASSAPAASATRIAFVSGSGPCEGQICTVDDKGRALKQLTTSALLAQADKPGCGLPVDGGKGPCMAQQPSFSKDGSRMVFQTIGPNSFQELWVMNPDGSHLTPLTATSTMSAIDHPTLSPDGSSIAFAAPSSSALDAPLAIWTVKASGAGLRMLTNPSTQRFASEPAWSPNGRQIAFTSFEGPGASGPSNPTGIYVMNADGTNIHRLPAAGPGSAQNPAWSPDGKWLVFSQLSATWETDHTATIYRMAPDGSNARALTHGGFWDGGPTVSPDGAKISFYRYRGTRVIPHLFVINADGSGLYQLLAFVASTPSWGRA